MIISLYNYNNIYKLVFILDVIFLGGNARIAVITPLNPLSVSSSELQMKFIHFKESGNDFLKFESNTHLPHTVTQCPVPPFCQSIDKLLETWKHYIIYQKN